MQFLLSNIMLLFVQKNKKNHFFKANNLKECILFISLFCKPFSAV